MIKNKIRIFHGLTEVAGQGFYSVLGLKKLGLSASIAVWRKNPAQYGDVCSLRIGKNKLLYPWYACKMTLFAVLTLFRFNVFHFHAYRSLLPYNVDMSFLKCIGKRVFMEFHGSELRKNKGENLPIKKKRDEARLRRVIRSTDAIILHDAELRPYLEECKVPVFYVPLRLDVRRFTPRYPSLDKKIPLIVHAPSRPEKKGTIYVINAIENLAKKYSFQFQLVHGLKQDEAIRIYEEADIIIDQLLRGTYGVFSIEGMALGKPVVCFISDEMRAEFPEELPIINANPETVEEVIESLLLDSEYRYKVGIRSRAYAEDYHDHTVNARILEKIYRDEMISLDQRAAFAIVKQMAKRNSQP